MRCLCVLMLTAGCCLGLLSAGCEGSHSSLTDAELDRIAMTEKIHLAEQAGDLVIIVGGESITSEEILAAPADPRRDDSESIAEAFKPLARRATLEQFKQQARHPLTDVLMGKISRILLYQHARRELGSSADEALEKMAEKELRRFILKYGGDEAKADAALRQMGLDREGFKQEHKKLIITQAYLARKLPYKKPVTYGELIEYYEKVKDKLFFTPAKLKFRLIDIDIMKLQVADPNLNPLAEARRLAAELLGRLRAGEDFAELAKEHSHGHRRSFGGLWPSVNPDSLAKPYDVLAKKAAEMEPGRVAGPIEAGTHIFIMKLEEKQPAHYQPLEEVQASVNEMILEDRRNEAITRLNDRLLREAAIGETDGFIDFCLEKIYRISNQEKPPPKRSH